VAKGVWKILSVRVTAVPASSSSSCPALQSFCLPETVPSNGTSSSYPKLRVWAHLCSDRLAARVIVWPPPFVSDRLAATFVMFFRFMKYLRLSVLFAHLPLISGQTGLIVLNPKENLNGFFMLQFVTFVTFITLSLFVSLVTVC
jgi:hypothetical protein